MITSRGLIRGVCANDGQTDGPEDRRAKPVHARSRANQYAIGDRMVYGVEGEDCTYNLRDNYLNCNVIMLL